MRKLKLIVFIFSLFFLFASTFVLAKSSTRNGYKYSNKKYSKSYFTRTKYSYNIGGTKYYYGQNYRNTGITKVKRSNSARNYYLKSRGLRDVPPGYEVDHIVPLSKGGSDQSWNMQLLPKYMHKLKSSSEKRRKY